MFIVDAKGLVCPKPVIMAKNALKEHDEITIEVDNPTSRENLEKMAVVMKLDHETKESGNFYAITLRKTEDAQNSEDNHEEYIIGISSEFAGTGDTQLGSALMKSFIYTVTEAEKLPKTMIFYNGGVKLTTEGSPVLEDLSKLQAAGVEILSCGTCLNFYGLTEKLKVGSVTNMYVIFEKQQKAAKIIRP